MARARRGLTTTTTVRACARALVEWSTKMYYHEDVKNELTEAFLLSATLHD
jgi:hypothetical protein